MSRIELERLSKTLAETALGRDRITGLILHDKQRAFVEHPAKRKVIVAGRRAGKTTGVAVLAARGFVAGRRVLYTAPTQEQTDQFWEYMKHYFGDGIAKGDIYKNETRRLLEDKGRIKAKTAWDADTMRGDYADLMFLEEFAMMAPSAWDEVGAPMLLDNDGDAIFVSTPKRRNHFYKLYTQALGDETGRWAYWHFTSYDNPYLPQKALEDITRDMTEGAYKQEILAEFLENEGSVFRNIQACLGAPTDSTPRLHRGHRAVMGVDWGKHQDSTAICIICADCGIELQHDRFNKVDYAFQRQRIKALWDRWKCEAGLGELNAMGEPNLESLQRDGVPLGGFSTTATSKPPLIESFALALEKEEIQLIDDPVWTSELEAYEMTETKHTGRPKYNAPAGMHDDTVIARALAWRAATSGGFHMAVL